MKRSPDTRQVDAAAIAERLLAELGDVRFDIAGPAIMLGIAASAAQIWINAGAADELGVLERQATLLDWGDARAVGLLWAGLIRQGRRLERLFSADPRDDARRQFAGRMILGLVGGAADVVARWCDEIQSAQLAARGAESHSPGQEI